MIQLLWGVWVHVTGAVWEGAVLEWVFCECYKSCECYRAWVGSVRDCMVLFVHHLVDVTCPWDNTKHVTQSLLAHTAHPKMLIWSIWKSDWIHFSLPCRQSWRESHTPLTVQGVWQGMSIWRGGEGGWRVGPPLAPYCNTSEFVLPFRSTNLQKAGPVRTFRLGPKNAIH
jgi:hypothetical protein